MGIFAKNEVMGLEKIINMGVMLILRMATARNIW
jgi:hypothetical protein